MGKLADTKDLKAQGYMKKILIYFILFFIFNLGNSFQAQAGTAGLLQYCFYKGRWSLIFKSEREFQNNTQWCKIVKKSEYPDFYGQIFRASIRHRGNTGKLLWYIETSRLRRIVDKHEASIAKYKKIEEEEKKVEKKKKPKKDTTSEAKVKKESDITEQLQFLIKQYKDGILSEEDFKNAKKKLLN